MDRYTPPAHFVNTNGISYSDMTREGIIQSGKSLSNTGGRHDVITEPIQEYLSDYSLQRERVRVMMVHLIQLSDTGCINISLEEQTKLLIIAERFSDDDYVKIFQYDHLGRNGSSALEHDVKAVEYFLQETFRELKLDHLIPYIHMLCTSEDVNNIAYQVNLRDATNDVILPRLRGIIQPLLELSNTHKGDAILGRTHGQVAVPTTFGKLIAVELNNLQVAMEPLRNLVFSGKFSGATGSNVDHKLAFPDIDWIKYEEKIVGRFGLRQNIVSDQRGQLMERVQLFQILQNINNVILNLSGKLHDLCARGILVQKQVAGEVGSSVMPGKTNPWRLEELEGAMKLANGGFQASIDNHNITRRERDLAEHPLERNYGEPFGQMFIGLTNISEQLSRFEFSSENANEELDKNPEVIGSGIQSVLRSQGIESAYNFLAKLMKGRNVTLEDIHGFIQLLSTPLDKKTEILTKSTEAVKDMESKLTPTEKERFYSIELDDNTRDALLNLDPKTYIGDSPSRTSMLAKQLTSFMGSVDTNVMLTIRRKRLIAVGWDFDDTLYLGDKEELGKRVKYIAKKLEITLSPEEHKLIVSKARWDEQKSELTRIARTQDIEVLDKEIEALQEQAKPQFSDLLRMDDYAVETLDLLERKGIPSFLITNRGPKTLKSAMDKFGLEQYFEYVADASHKLRKPNPALMQEALGSLGIKSEHHVKYIGDHPEFDVEFAKNSGVTPVEVNRGGRLNTPGIVTANNMEEVYRILSLELL